MNLSDMFKHDDEFKRTLALFKVGALEPKQAVVRLIDIGWTAEQAWAFVMMESEKLVTHD